MRRLSAMVVVLGMVVALAGLALAAGKEKTPDATLQLSEGRAAGGLPPGPPTGFFVARGGRGRVRSRPRRASRYYFSSVNFTPSPASFRFTPLVMGKRWITTPFWFFIAVAPAPTPTVTSAAADTYVPLKSSSFFRL